MTPSDLASWGMLVTASTHWFWRVMGVAVNEGWLVGEEVAVGVGIAVGGGVGEGVAVHDRCVGEGVKVGCWRVGVKVPL